MIMMMMDYAADDDRDHDHDDDDDDTMTMWMCCHRFLAVWQRPAGSLTHDTSPVSRDRMWCQSVRSTQGAVVLKRSFEQLAIWLQTHSREDRWG